MALLLVCLHPHIHNTTLPFLMCFWICVPRFQSFLFFFFFQISFGSLASFLSARLNHTLPIYLTSGCLPVIIFLFVLLHPSVSVPHLSFSIAILTFLFQSLSSPLPPQLPLEQTFTFSVSVSHTFTYILLRIFISEVAKFKYCWWKITKLNHKVITKLKTPS